MLEFHKYQGTGNDFILVDNRNGQFPKEKQAFISRLCDRKFGIGSDGLILIEGSTHADFRMIFHNPDATLSFCGNGSRCAVAFASEVGIGNKSGMHFEAIDGVHDAHIKDDLITVKMSDANDIELTDEGYHLDTGAPHVVKFVPDVHQAAVFDEGRRIRHLEKFYGPAGTNVNFVQEMETGLIFVRTYERGVENETLSCGTGVTGAALVYGKLNDLENVNVKTPGGDLKVSFQYETTKFTNVYLEGPASRVFSGTINIDQRLQ